MPSSRVSSQPRDRTYVSCISCIAGRFFTTEPPGKPTPFLLPTADNGSCGHFGQCSDLENERHVLTMAEKKHGSLDDTLKMNTRLHILVQFSSVAQSCPTLCDPMNRSTPGLPVHHQLLEFTQTHVHQVSDAIQPSHPLASPSPPAPNPSQHQSLFQ